MAWLKFLPIISGALSLLPGTKAAALTTRGSTLVLNGTQYFILPSPISQLASLCPSLSSCVGSTDLYVGATVIDATAASFCANDVEATIASFLQQDDVFQEGFLQTLIVKSSNTSLLQSLQIPSSVQCTCVTSNLSSTSLPQGPYVISTQNAALFIPYRLYVDSQEAFTTGVLPSPEGGFQPIAAAITASSSVTIGVPSRLYYQKTAQQPLAGVRLGVKDLYDLEGLKTGAGSRAYYAINDPANVTAPAVQRLLDAGAIVVGKMKTAQFAAPEFASLAIDYQAPFNGRADGYQEPGSSSSGPGAGMSSYSWLDIALGSDTGGSVRVPAQENGLYGNRPTWGAVTLDNVFPLGPTFDTAGLLARDPQLWRQACHVMYSGLTQNYTRYPSRIQTFSLSPASETVSTPADALATSFVQKLISFLSANVSSLNYTQQWIDTRPSGTNADLKAYLNTTWETLTAVPQIQLVREPFFAKYAAKYNGREPYVNPDARAAWDWALATNPDVDVAATAKATFQQWWNTNIVTKDPDFCSESLVVYSGKDTLSVAGKPSYRDTEIPTIGLIYDLLGGLFVAPMTGVPDFVVPIGEVSYNSTVTNHVEQLPVTIDIMAATGCDLMLLDLIVDLQKAGILSTVQPGTSSVTGGPIYI